MDCNRYSHRRRSFECASDAHCGRRPPFDDNIVIDKTGRDFSSVRPYSGARLNAVTLGLPEAYIADTIRNPPQVQLGCLNILSLYRQN